MERGGAFFTAVISFNFFIEKMGVRPIFLFFSFLFSFFLVLLQHTLCHPHDKRIHFIDCDHVFTR